MATGVGKTAIIDQVRITIPLSTIKMSVEMTHNLERAFIASQRGYEWYERGLIDG